MASIFDYQFNVGGNFTATMEGMIDNIGKFNAKIKDCNNWVGRVSNTLATFDMASNYVEKLSGVFSGLTEAGSAAELQLMNLKTLFGGNAEAAADMYERISDYGKVTPYDKAGLLEAQRTMMSFGLSGEAAFSTLKQIGDIAMGDSQKMQSLALAFAQMSSTGKLTGQDLMQMINAGFNPLNEISKQTGKSVGELKEEMSNGAISANMVSEAFRSATSEGGLFYGAIEAASNTTAGKMASIQDSIEEIKVGLFNFFGDIGIWITILGQLVVPLSQIYPLLMAMGKMMLWIKGLQWATMWSSIKGFLYASRIQMMMMNRELITGQFASNGFLVNITRATLAVVRFATVGLWNAIKGMAVFILDMLTGGGTVKAFGTIASASFSTFAATAKTACRSVGVAIMNIPIIGWIAAAIAALIAIGAYFWNTSAKFRAVLKGLWASFKSVFTGLGELAGQVFGAIGDLIKAAFSLDGKGIDAALSKLKKGFTDYGSQVGKAFNDAYNAEMAASKKDEAAKNKKESQTALPTSVPHVEIPAAATTSDPTAGTLESVGKSSASSSSDKVNNVTVNIEKLVERFEIHTTNLQGDISRVKDMVSEALLSALNDVNLAM